MYQELGNIPPSLLRYSSPMFQVLSLAVDGYTLSRALVPIQLPPTSARLT